MDLIKRQKMDLEHAKDSLNNDGAA